MIMLLKTTIVLLGCTAFTFAASRRPFTLSVHELVCYRYGDPLSEFKCNLETVNNQTVVNLYLILSQEVKSFEFETSAEIPQLKDGPNKLFNFKVDGCDTLSAITGNNILKVALSHIRKVGHIPKRCPISANENFTLTRYLLEADILPLYTPEFSFKFVVNGYFESIVVGKLVAKGRVETKRKRLNG